VLQQVLDPGFASKPGQKKLRLPLWSLALLTLQYLLGLKQALQ
jgi:hypothetical protein